MPDFFTPAHRVHPNAPETGIREAAQNKGGMSLLGSGFDCPRPFYVQSRSRRNSSYSAMTLSRGVSGITEWLVPPT